MRVVTLNIDGQEVTAPVLKHGNTLWVHLNGRTLSFEPESSRVSKKKQLVDDPTKIVAPMPGKIIKVQCVVGDKVTDGQTLIVMEAMKMEYALKIHASGVVKKLSAQSGLQASLGDVLVEIESEKAP